MFHDPGPPPGPASAIPNLICSLSTLNTPAESVATLQVVARLLEVSGSTALNVVLSSDGAGIVSVAHNLTASWDTYLTGMTLSGASAVNWSNLSVTLTTTHVGTTQFGAVKLSAGDPTSVVTAPSPPTIKYPYIGQTYGGVIVPFLWQYSGNSGSGSLTTPYIDISISTDCGTTFSVLTESVDSVGYLWDSTSALTITDCTVVRFRESNETKSSWVTVGPLFPPHIWVPPPISTDTETWSGVTTSQYTWQPPSASSSVETWSAESCPTSTWGGSGCSGDASWNNVGV